ncbi:T9SS type A sorting domain-containing protein [Chryseobacterium sp. MP_3.2]|uniref:T9SS type A sorting domain-containing protein n=1 Tax=Chryseobacterium sp. MP_3.2 TaxID=3071712 RepID=UPI002E079EC6|nr:hypothetical protein [Chryseobacterium sp. MP_3.2]
MKKLLFSFALLVCSFMLNAQITVTRAGNTITLTTPIPGADWGSSPVNLYAYAEPTDTTPMSPATVQILGNWPGKALTDNGNGTFSVSVDLSTQFPPGTTINNFKFIYNSPDGSGGYYQNPAGGSPGFNITDPAHATGYSTITLATTNLSNANKSSFVVNGQLRTSLKGDIALEVYEMSGKLIRSFKAVATGNAIDLNVTKTGTYLVKITNGASQEIVKFVK